jgi:hypothetical protein
MQVTIQGDICTKFLTICISSTFSKHLWEDKKTGEGEGIKTIKKYYNIFISYNVHYVQNRNAHSNFGTITFSFRLGVMLRTEIQWIP